MYRRQRIPDRCQIARAVRRVLRCKDLGGCRINDEMQLAPGSAITPVGRSGRATVSSQACAIHDDVYGATSSARMPHLRPQRRGSARQGGVVGNLDIELQEPDDGSKETFRLSQGQAVDRTDDQRRLNGCVRIAALAACFWARSRMPVAKCLL